MMLYGTLPTWRGVLVSINQQQSSTMDTPLNPPRRDRPVSAVATAAVETPKEGGTCSASYDLWSGSSWEIGASSGRLFRRLR